MIQSEVIRQLNNAWLNVNVQEDFIINPLDRLQTDDPDEFYKRLTCLFMNPNYFSFICKHVLNIELLPMQALILKEMWNRKFPMLVGSRGLGKTFLLSLYCMLRAILIPERKIDSLSIFMSIWKIFGRTLQFCVISVIIIAVLDAMWICVV